MLHATAKHPLSMSVSEILLKNLILNELATLFFHFCHLALNY